MPAIGPCMLREGKRWAMPLVLCRLWSGRTQGVLTVIPKREGGSVNCTYKLASGSGRRSWSWTIKTSALAGSYEESLFKTWPCDANPWDGKAFWVVQSAEANHLEIISQHVDTLLNTLGKNGLYHGMVEAVAGVARNKHAGWKPAQLQWTYVWQLDQVLEHLKYVVRKATVAGGNNPADRLASRIWPVPQHATDRMPVQVSNRLDDRVPLATGAAPAGAVNTAVHRGMPLPMATGTRHESDLSVQHPREESNSLVSPTAVCESTAPDCLPHEHAAMKQEGRGPTARSRVPETTTRRGRGTHATRPSGRKTGGLHVSSPQGDGERQSGDGTSTPNENLPPTGDLLLAQELVQHHRPLRRPPEYTPVSLMQLQQRLQWSPAGVQCAMARLFGGKPFRVYREKCKDRTICTFLLSRNAE